MSASFRILEEVGSNLVPFPLARHGRQVRRQEDRVQWDSEGGRLFPLACVSVLGLGTYLGETVI